jgi:hypothetical protein
MTGESFVWGAYNERMTQTKSAAPLILMALMLFVVLFVFFTYTFLHESGHVLTGWLFGQTLAEFDVSFWDFSAHVAQVDLSTRAYSAETLARFSLDKSTYVGIFIAIRGIKTTYFDLSLTGPDGYSSVIMHGEGYSAFQDGGLWEENLAPGTYQIVLTSHPSPGTASVYIKTH